MIQRTDQTIGSLLKNLLSAVLALLPGLCGAQTILSGNISGSWSASGNPYIIADTATVQSGQTLTIQPGVIVWINSGVSLMVNGRIQASGTASQHITFRSFINSQYWNTISVNNSETNIFNYCDFLNATNALAFVGSGSNQVNYCTFTAIMGTGLAFNITNYNVESDIRVSFNSFQNVSNGVTLAVVSGISFPFTANVANCSFSNCWGTAVSGIGNGGHNLPGWIVATIQNCSFSSIGIGCGFKLSGVNYFGDYNGNGMGDVQLLDNLFNNVTDAVIFLTNNIYVKTSPATLANNIILNASNAVVFQDPWDATVLDNIFVGCTTAARVSGSLSRNVEYNDFFNNASNFVGYPSEYGTIALANRNGTPCDLFSNIFQNPLFVATNNFNLQTDSPCIGAGSPDPAYMNTSFPPSQGASFPDLGIYGGPLAANWLPAVPSTPTPIILTASPAVLLTSSNFLTAGSYQIQSSPDLLTWADYGSPFYIDIATNLVDYVDATNGAEFFRLQSLQ